jgi:hypothetical protein
MAYNKDNATTFNQLIQLGLSVEEATVQSGISADAASYGAGTNDNTGAIIPGAGGILAESGLTQVSYTQPGIAVDAQSSLKNVSVPVIDPRIIVSATPRPTVTTVTQEFPFVNNITNIDPELAAIAAAAAQPSPFGDDNTGIDPELAAIAAAEAQVIAAAAAQPSPFGDDNTGISPEPAAAEAQAIAAAAAQPSPYGDNATGISPEPAAAEAKAIADAQAQPSPYAIDVDPELAALAAAEAQAIRDAELNNATASNSQAVVGTQLAQRQAVLEAQRKLVNNGDWRVRLSLAAGADYLYNESPNGILWPLKQTNGVIFPYMPKIDVGYKADYDSYSLTHSNYKGYFYKSSYTDAVTLTATFTAQDTSEANYLLAVIHFFRSVTKMFYGQDAQRGAPPPMVYLTGLGEYQFAAHPCVVSSFQYNLPNDVDYIRAGSPNTNGTNLLTRRSRQDLPTNPITGAVKRLENLFSSQGINKGAISSPPAPPTLGKNSPTYVPTKIDCTISLLPMQTRAQVSQVFSLKSFANGDLIKGGFW